MSSIKKTIIPIIVERCYNVYLLKGNETLIYHLKISVKNVL